MTSRGTIDLVAASGTGTDAVQDFSVSYTGVQFVRFDIQTNQEGDNFVTDTFIGDGLNAAGLGAVRFDATPEPSSTALLGLGGLALILRRRK